MKFDGSNISVIGDTVTIDGVVVGASTHSTNVDLTGSPSQGLRLRSKGQCVDLLVDHRATSHIPGYFHNMNLRISDKVVEDEGVCGSTSGRHKVQRKHTLFNDQQLANLCQMCGMSDCSSALGNRRLAEGVHSIQAPAMTAEDACTKAGILLDVARDKCKALDDPEDTFFLEACVFDYCASNGDDALVANAMDAKRREVTLGTANSASTTTSTIELRNHPTTTTLRQHMLSAAEPSQSCTVAIVVVFAMQLQSWLVGSTLSL